MNQKRGSSLLFVHDPVAKKHLSHHRLQFSCLNKSDTVNIMRVCGAGVKTTK